MKILKWADIKKLSAFFILVLLSACAGPKPAEELVLAKVALEAAKEVGAASAASGYWYRAEENYRKGQEALKSNYNYDAREFFIQAKNYAEKAENSTRLKKFKSGESYP
ncbi:MAG: DUF4398 domain-containing protein [Bdellovibrionales bacterium]|nr:DUF4398 domain-containing protein [Bdellovibrionales bacterium]